MALIDRLKQSHEEFKLGKKICEELLYDYLNPQNPLYPSEIHKTRVDGINPEKDFLVGCGYLFGVLKNFVKHPIIMYKILILKE